MAIVFGEIILWYASLLGFRMWDFALIQWQFKDPIQWRDSKELVEFKNTRYDVKEILQLLRKK